MRWPATGSVRTTAACSGRLAGSVPGFDYSEAMKKSRIVWNDATLDRFLAMPWRWCPAAR